MDPENPTIPTPPPQVTPPAISPVFPKKNNLAVILLSVLLLITLLVSGYLFLQVQSLTKQLAQSQIQPIPTPLSTEIPSSTTDPTANWKTYSNTKYGYSFKYPSEYQIGSCTSCLNLTAVDFVTLLPPNMTSAKGYGSFMISHLKDKGTNQSASDYLNELSTIVNQPVVPNSQQQTTINGYSALIVINRDKFNDVDSKNVYVTNGTEGIQLSFDGYYSNENRGIHLDSFKNLSVFDQVLSSFKFLNTNNPLGQYCAGPNNLPCPAGYACKLNVIGDIASGGKCVNESETNP